MDVQQPTNTTWNEKAIFGLCCLMTPGLRELGVMYDDTLFFYCCK